MDMMFKSESMADSHQRQQQLEELRAWEEHGSLRNSNKNMTTTAKGVPEWQMASESSEQGQSQLQQRRDT